MHDAARRGVERVTPVHGAAVVPQHQIAHSPAVREGDFRPRRMRPDFVEQSIRFRQSQPLDPRHPPAPEVQHAPPAVRMGADQRVQRPRRLPLTGDPDLHLLVDGERLNPARHANGTYVFHLSGSPAAARIVSRASAPQELGLARDPRVLGVAVRRIDARRGVRLRVIEADDALLDLGFHAFEPDNGFRWTNGDATIPAQTFAGFTDPFVIELTVASTMHYLDEGGQLRVA
jgi:hypothetical protein